MSKSVSRQNFEDRMEVAFRVMAENYNNRLDGSFYEVRTWEAPFGDTYRKRGDFVPGGYRRDTADTETLVKGRDSVFPSKMEMEVKYPISYAYDVFNGARVNKKNIPARPLPQIVAGEMEWAEEFKAAWDVSG
jgi:hypothetical protein